MVRRSNSLKIITAIDSFKGCLSSAEANQTAAEGILSAYPHAEVVQIPVSDGGEGWLEAFSQTLGGSTVELTVADPLMRPVRACYLLRGDTAVVEIAQASGLTLLTSEERNPLRTTSYGTGQLIAHAVKNGATHIIVGLGGSATSDCGRGMLQALQDAFLPTPIVNVRFTLASDVTNPLCGPQGAAHIFAPQKGATPEMVTILDEQARQFAEESARKMGYDCQNQPGAGAAGGLGYAFLQYLHAACRPGIQLLLEAIHFDELLKGTSLVITGEGRADAQTLMGKLPSGILKVAQAQGVPTILLAGSVSDKETLLQAGFYRVEGINPPGLPLEEALKKKVAQGNLTATVERLLLSL